jgi:hypothetical protein
MASYKVHRMHRLGQDNRPGNSRFPPPPRDAAAALLPYQLHFDFFPNAFVMPKLYTLPLASGQRSALIQVVLCALKAVPEAIRREERAIHRTTIFFWFFSCEKEKNA